MRAPRNAAVRCGDPGTRTGQDHRRRISPPRGIDNNIPGNAATQFYGLLNSSTQITVAKEFARVKGGHVPEISKLRAGNFYAALEGTPFYKITTPWCLSHHPHSPLTTEEVLELARRPLGSKPAP